MSQNEFTPTHVAPSDGLQAWDEPDPSKPAIAQVQPGVRMQLLERRGAWAHVVFSNGWKGWVDGRRMLDVPARPTPPPQPQPLAAQQSQQPQQSTISRPASPAAEEPATAGLAGQPADATRPVPTAFPAPGSMPAQQSAPTQHPAADQQPQPQPQQPGIRAQRPGPVSPVSRERAQPAAKAVQDSTFWSDDLPEAAPAAPAGQTQTLRPSGSRSGGRGDGGKGLAVVAGVKISVAAIGVAAIVLGSLISWIRMSGFNGNAFRVPLNFLIDYKTTGGGIKVGLVLLAVAAAAGVFCVLPGKVNVRRVLGGVVAAVAVLYVLQLQRVLSAAGEGAPSITSVIGFGVPIVLAGGIAMVVDKTEPNG